MSLHTVEPEIATGETAALFTATHRALGVIPNLTRVMANSPAVLKGYLGIVTTLSAEGTLPAQVRESIALLVAQENGSDYCLSVHAFRGTRTAGLSAAEATGARRGRADDPWAAAVLELAASTVRDRGTVADEQLAAARRAGLSDGQIVEVIAHVALNVFTNYLATAARVEVDWPLVRHTDWTNAPSARSTPSVRSAPRIRRTTNSTDSTDSTDSTTKAITLPTSVHVKPLQHVSAAEAVAWHQVVQASTAHDLPGVPTPDLGQIQAQLTRPALGSRRLMWLATSTDGVPVGVAALRVFTSPGQEHLAEVDLHVDPAHRRLGTGSLLLSAVAAACRAENRRSLIATAPADGPGEAFGGRRGFRRALALSHLLLRLDETDRADVLRIADAEHPGYRLTGWTGTVPDGLAAAFAAAKNAMNDAPVGDLDYGSVAWDADRVRAMAAVVADRGDTLLTVAAVHDSGAMAGYTEIVIPHGAPPRVQQYDTAVVPEHRGHGLGLWVKAAMASRLRAEHPGVVEIETDNADDNVHMLAVNHRLGFRPYRRTCELQLDLDLPA
ncbi:GNAT family N-acetyltransferase [Streptomyces sp. ZAF1911]|uniref:GNAT family N-acetyltransferase n=1 Tax=Streptomyces sp. ZAF1911 TaxID=2944129 RepID=UPI00237C4E75|nr:GNAT family N-acetyltransferase [Streptomyces sp. ZAF1911]MDD9380986.1 GNAT family N-acetyltransferase [Streptomyces sp. ZAF1911]